MTQIEGLKAAVLGWPVSHSLSPRLHQYWLKQYKIVGSYEALPVEPENLKSILHALHEQGYAGVNLTLPHKEQALKIVDEADANARRIGAVNTIIVNGEKLFGTNTDAYGFTTNLKALASPSQAGNALVLGAGGAARAVIDGLLNEGWEVTIAARNLEKAQSLVSNYRFPDVKKEVKIISWEQLSKAMPHSTLLVNTTPLGMRNHEPLNISLETLPFSAIVYDIIYNPLMTPLLKEAKLRGNPIVTGLGMLLYQAQPAFEAWFGVRPEVTSALYTHMLEAV